MKIPAEKTLSSPRIHCTASGIRKPLREEVFSTSNIPTRIVSMNDLANMTATFNMRSLSGYDRFCSTNEWIDV
jgi:hypothetical protein